MPLIHLTTKINAPVNVVFDLARNISFHQTSASKTQEKAIAGRTSGLIELGETVTWEAVHFGLKQQLTTQITAMNAPHSFRDEMLYGAFKSIKHEHFFYLNSTQYQNTANAPSVLFNASDINPLNQQCATIMVDLFHYEAPLGVLGELANALFLKKYMKRFLQVRNEAIKKEAETLSRPSKR